MTLLPSGILRPGDNGTSCMILPVITWPGLPLADETVEFKRTGNMVPRGMVGLALSCELGCLELAGCRRNVAHNNVPKNKTIVRTKTCVETSQFIFIVYRCNAHV